MTTGYDRETDADLLAIPRPRLTSLRIPLVVAGFGILYPVARNLSLRRPIYAGIQLHALCGLVGFAIGSAVENWRERRYAEHWATIRHYVSLHPEEFVLEERKKFGDLFLDWNPRR